MDFKGGGGGFAGGNPSMTPENSNSVGTGYDNYFHGGADQPVWATEDDYRSWNYGPSDRSGDEPMNSKTRSLQSANSDVNAANRSRAIGKMFYKTKMCCKFRQGICPYITNCNFAHSVEELRKPPPNWQEIVAAHEGDQRGDRGVSAEPPAEEHQIPTLSSLETREESQRSYKGRHCKKFYTEEGCPYGDNCTFLHDEQSLARESVAICVTPTIGDGYGSNVNTGPNLKPSNWKTRICNKWETTGYCPFGSKCHFAHGLGELHKYGGGLMDGEGNPVSSTVEQRQSMASLKPTDAIAASAHSAPRADVYHTGGGVPSQRLSGVPQMTSERPLQKWKGPNKISKVYGDWIDDFE